MTTAAGAYSSPVAETGERPVTDNKNLPSILRTTRDSRVPASSNNHNCLPILPKPASEVTILNSAEAKPPRDISSVHVPNSPKLSADPLHNPVDLLQHHASPYNAHTLPPAAFDNWPNHQSHSHLPPRPVLIPPIHRESTLPNAMTPTNNEPAVYHAQLPPASQSGRLYGKHAPSPSLNDARLPENLANLAKISSPIGLYPSSLPPLLQLPEIRRASEPNSDSSEEKRTRLPNIGRIFDIVHSNTSQLGPRFNDHGPVSQPGPLMFAAPAAAPNPVPNATPDHLPDPVSNSRPPPPVVPYKRPLCSLSSLISAAEAVDQGLAENERLRPVDSAPSLSPLESEPAIPKRGRGRPRKAEKVSEVSASAGETVAVVKRGRGRPRKSETVQPPPLKISRQSSPETMGLDSSDSDLSSETSSDAPAVSKRGRGRPRKHPFGPHPKPEQPSQPAIKPHTVSSCWTCKLRRKKCDQTRPVCTTCLSLGIPCMGYDPNRPDYMIVARKNKEMRAKIAQIVQQNREQAKRSESPTAKVLTGVDDTKGAEELKLGLEAATNDGSEHEIEGINQRDRDSHPGKGDVDKKGLEEALEGSTQNSPLENESFVKESAFEESKHREKSSERIEKPAEEFNGMSDSEETLYEKLEEKVCDRVDDGSEPKYAEQIEEKLVKGPEEDNYPQRNDASGKEVFVKRDESPGSSDL